MKIFTYLKVAHVALTSGRLTTTLTPFAMHGRPYHYHAEGKSRLPQLGAIRLSATGPNTRERRPLGQHAEGEAECLRLARIRASGRTPHCGVDLAELSVVSSANRQARRLPKARP